MNTRPMRQFKLPIHPGLLIPGVLTGLLVCSVCTGDDDVIMFRGATPSAEDLADIMFPKSADQHQEEPGSQGPRVRGIHVNPSGSPAEQPASTGASFGFNIEFAFDSDEVLPESSVYLDRVAEMMNSPQAENRSILIIGHTDASGPQSYNKTLSQRRARAVKDYLSGRHGISTNRMQVAGQGEETPLPGRDPYDPANRRVEFHPVEP